MSAQEPVSPGSVESAPWFPATHIGLAGVGKLDGQVFRPGDPLKHLGPPDGLQLPTWSPLWSTRCGLQRDNGAWQACSDDDDVWCSDCLRQAGVPHSVEPI